MDKLLKCEIMVDLLQPNAYEKACNELLAALVEGVFEGSHYMAAKHLGMHRASIAHRIGPSKRKPLENAHARRRGARPEQPATSTAGESQP